MTTRKPTRASLSIEPLEDRNVPSTFTVTNLADPGPGSLRYAVAAANDHPGADAVRFASQVRGSIALATGDLVVSDDLTLTGPGADWLTVSGEHKSRVFRIDEGAEVVISGLRIANGQAPEDVVTPLGLPLAFGGGILNIGGRLTLNRVVVADNLASGFIGAGGGVGCASGAVLIATACTCTGNRAFGAYDAVGGAVGQDDGSSMLAAACTFRDNQAAAGSGDNPEDSFQGVGAGGGIASGGGSRLTILRSTFVGNVGHGGDASEPGQTGGRGHGGAILSTNASYYNPAAATATLYVEDTTFIGNTGVGGTGGAGGAGGDGFAGAIDNDNGSTGVLTRCQFIGNAGVGGIAGPGGGSGGGGSMGAVSNTEGSALRAVGCVFVGNRAVGAPGADGPTGGQGGNAGGGAFEDGASGLGTEFVGCAFIDNRAVAGAGGPGLGGNDGHGGSAQGGAVLIADGGFVSMTGCLLLGNVAMGGVTGGDGLGGGVAVLSGSATVRACVLNLNRAVGGDGPHGGAGFGGSIFVAAGASVNVEASQNRA